MTKLTPATWKKIMAQHDSYWDLMRPDLRRYMLAYEQRYWERSETNSGVPSAYGGSGEALTIETSRMYEFVEGYQASLFSKEPAVVVGPDIRGRGKPEVTQAACNHFLDSCRSVIEDASRLSHLYPFSALKMAVSPNSNPFRRVNAVTVAGWDVIVDETSSTWETQRYVGHRYWVSIAEAKERWGNKDYMQMERIEYLEKASVGDVRRRAFGTNEYISASEEDNIHSYIPVVEVYDILGDRLLIWSPSYQDGQKWLDAGKEIEIDGVKGTYDRIPFRSVDDEPIVPLWPLYYSRKPHQPLRGVPPARRVYDQCQEINISRTFQANAGRKAARQWITRKGAFNADSMTKLTQGVDGEIIEVDPPVGGRLEDTILPVPHSPNPPEVESYIQMVQSDLDRGSVLAPFTRGEASGGTATEVRALASYSASEIGRLARERDSLIENVCRIYTAMLAMFIEDRDIVWLDGQALVVKPEDFEGDFEFYAEDGGSTPQTEAARKADLLEAIPVLQSLGVKNDKIVKELVRLFGFPKDFVPDPAEVEAAAFAEAAPPPQEIPLSPGEGPMAAMLPGGI